MSRNGEDTGALVRLGSDPLAGLRRYLQHGGTLREAALLTGVPRSTLQRYLADGIPNAGQELLVLMTRFRRDGRIRD